MGKIFTITEGLENMGALRTGGQGSVYKGRRTGQIITAVKLLPTPIHAEDERDKNYKDFKNEVEKLKKVNQEPNPNVVKILNSGITESGSLPFIEMEFIEGPDLEELLKPPHATVFTIREVIKVADQLSNALAHCHKVGVRHGDIKSNNVKLNIHSGNYMLLDFGLAVMSDEQRRTSLRHAGAIEFMAPEQNDGEMLFQTDVYSFGIIIFELLAGTVPFPLHDNGETSRNNVMVSHLEAPLPDILELRRSNLPESFSKEKKDQEMRVPEWLLAIVSKCLNKKPEDRYANGQELHKVIVSNSVLPTNNTAYGKNDISVLQSENERLKNLLLQYQDAAITTDEGSVDNMQKTGADKDTYSLNSDGTFAGKILRFKSQLGSLKPVPLLLLIGFLFISGFATSAFFYGNIQQKEIPKAMALVDTSKINQQTKKLQDSIEALNAMRIQDSIASAKRIYAAKKAAEASLVSEKDSKKGKKKKFLGISF